jgi:hypothetical protein
MLPGQMSQPAEPDLTFEAFQGADAFSIHVRSLVLRTRQVSYSVRSPAVSPYSELDGSEVAETVWAKWPSKRYGSSAP